MAITNYGSKDVAITFGGTTVTSYFDPSGDFEREAILQESTPFGVAWQTFVDTGSRKLTPFTLKGVEDFQASTGHKSLFSIGTSATFVVTLGGAKTISFTAIVTKYKTSAATQKAHVVDVTFQPSGTVTEA